jgi:hypothetical protein
MVILAIVWIVNYLHDANSEGLGQWVYPQVAADHPPKAN